ncbi:hypothetical protein [Undibacterium luofuense]|uniref:Uncharacterized protein n=1 Tax=Undibacterium luofuense TaxID=2828733 RepID=A0A941DP50_9BURK|nr:hypothetical protein [Undibacterium luofuense]MBR7781531.1 hypothetical protein [Undibacterium luofuense]
MQNLSEQGSRATELKPVLGSLLAAGIMTFLLSQRGAAFMLILFGFICIPWLLQSIYYYISKPAQRKLLMQKIRIWLIALFLITGIHLLRHHHVRNQGQDIADRIQHYADEHGHYPPSLQSIGTPEELKKGTLVLFGYRLPDNKESDAQPAFFYMSTYVALHVERYDFNTRRWEHEIPDRD